MCINKLLSDENMINLVNLTRRSAYVRKDLTWKLEKKISRSQIFQRRYVFHSQLLRFSLFFSTFYVLSWYYQDSFRHRKNRYIKIVLLFSNYTVLFMNNEECNDKIKKEIISQGEAWSFEVSELYEQFLSCYFDFFLVRSFWVLPTAIFTRVLFLR